MSKIPTAEEFLNKNYFYIKTDLNKTESYINIEDIYNLMIEFAKLHVEAALKRASEKATTTYEEVHILGEIYNVNKDSIINSYPLENIK